MVDSFGRSVAENDFGGGDAAAAGADGTAAASNASVVIADNAGHTASATSDALGYYRINIKGFSPPLVAKVALGDGGVWYAHSTTPIQPRGFITININGLTDKVGGYMADASNLGGDASKVTAQVLAANPSLLQAAKDKLNTGLVLPLTYAGFNPASFDPTRLAYQAFPTDPYQGLLKQVSTIKDKASGRTAVACIFVGAGGPFSYQGLGDIAVDGAGNVYVADTADNVVRKITPAGAASTFAGNGLPGFTNGVGTAVSFNRLGGVAVDGSGNVFVADSGNHAVRKITPNGVVSTVAGNGSPGFADGTGAAASFNYPGGVAIDGSGNILVADTGNHAIRKITPAGVVSTLAGSGAAGLTNGSGAAATFNGPHGVAVDGNGNVLVADTLNNSIRKITPGGVVSTFAGSGAAGSANGAGTTASFNYPTGVAVDSSGKLFVADQSNNLIRQISPAGVVST